MKKTPLSIIILLSIVALPCYSQIVGIDLTSAIPSSSITNDPFPYEKLIDLEDGRYVLSFKQTPVGYKHCLDKAKGILSDNGGDFSKDRARDEVMYPPNIKGLTDYQNLPHELLMSRAEVDLLWVFSGEYSLRLFCNDEIFSVYILPKEVLLNSISAYNDTRGLNTNSNAGAAAYGSQGIAEGDGNQGDTNGSPDADNYGTGGGLGNAITVSGIGSRGANGSLPKPMLSGCEITSKIEVKVEIVVDQDGRVISAIVQSATYQDNCLWAMVVDAAKRSRFPEDRDASFRQTGWIKYVIVP